MLPIRRLVGRGRMSDEEAVLRLGDTVVVAVDGERRKGTIKTLGNVRGPFVVVVDPEESEILAYEPQPS